MKGGFGSSDSLLACLNSAILVPPEGHSNIWIDLVKGIPFPTWN